MILWPQPDGSVLATPQPAHAIIAGQLMRRLAARPEPFEPAVTAAIEHDCAWQPWEMAPEFDSATGLPRAFNALSGEEHVPMWERGVAMALANFGQLVGLLVMRHGSHIYRLGILGGRVAPSAASLAAMQGYMAREREQGAAIMARLGMTEAQVAPLSQQLGMVDSIALALCWGQAAFSAGTGTLARIAPMAARIDPWPFDAPALEVATEALHIPAPFADAGAMRAAWPDLPRRMLRFTLCGP
jgi:hypothetical protein